MMMMIKVIIIIIIIIIIVIMKKALRETQTLRTGCSKPEQKNLPRCSPLRDRVHAGCSKAEPKFSPAADPLPGGPGRLKCNQPEMVTTFTYKLSLVKIDARNFELRNFELSW